MGLIVSAGAAYQAIGLAPEPQQNKRVARPQGLVRALFPLWVTILILLVTRIKQLGINGLLKMKKPAWDLELGSIGTFSVSPSLVVSLREIFHTPVSWSHAFLFIPSIIPFSWRRLFHLQSLACPVVPWPR